MPTESTTRRSPRAGELLRAVLGARETADRDLLARFVRSHDEEAFAELVRRHGRMVLAVGRRVTGHSQDAEDAFQAAFLVLARRAGHLKRPDQLANWLYGVAYRTALEARAARRRIKELVVPTAPEPAAPLPPDDTADLRRVIDEELSKLPDKYRSAVVLCDLEGVSRAEAASRLKVPEGTLSSRLAHARKLLSGRLSLRGIGSTAGAVAVVFAREAMGSTVRRELLQITARAAAKTAAGAAIPANLVSPSVSSITDGVMKTMLAHRLLAVLGAVMACGLLGLGAYGMAQAPSTNGIQPPAGTTEAVSPPADAFTGQYTVEPKPEKVAAKGIEDDDVPLTATPAQAVVRVEEGKLIVRQRSSQYQAVTIQRGGATATGYQRKSSIHVSTHDTADVAVFDMKGNRLAMKAWKEKMKNDVHVLLGYDGKLPNPRELTLFKEDTLLVVLPTSGTGANTGAYVWDSFGGTAPQAVPAFPPTQGKNVLPPTPSSVPGSTLPRRP